MQRRQRNIAVLQALFPEADVFHSERLLEENSDDIERVVNLIYNELNTRHDDEREGENGTTEFQNEDDTEHEEPNEPRVVIRGECTEGKVITATWEYGRGYTPGGNDTVGLYIYNRRLNKSFYSSKKVAKCLPACECNFSVLYDGFYELRYFAGPVQRISEVPDTTLVCRSGRILVGSEVPMHATLCEDSVRVQWDNKTSVAGDWIGLYNTHVRSNKEYIGFQAVDPVHLETPVAVIDFELPCRGGEYEFRYFRSASTSYLNGYFCSGYSNPFQIRCEDDKFSYFQNGMMLHVFFTFLSELPSPRDRIEIEDHGTVIGVALCGKYKERLERKNAGIIPVDLQKKNYVSRKDSCKEWKMKFISGDDRVLRTTDLSLLRM